MEIKNLIKLHCSTGTVKCQLKESLSKFLGQISLSSDTITEITTPIKDHTLCRDSSGHSRSEYLKGTILYLTLEGPCIIFCNIYTFQREIQCSCTECLLMHMVSALHVSDRNGPSSGASF